jgi:hypothetical protein
MVREKSGRSRDLDLSGDGLLTLFRHVLRTHGGDALECGTGALVRAKLRKSLTQGLWIIKFLDAHHRPDAVLKPDKRFAVARGLARVRDRLRVHAVDIHRQVKVLTRTNLPEHFHAAGDARYRPLPKFECSHRRPRCKLADRFNHKRRGKV